jgi:hypothetical protein
MATAEGKGELENSLSCALHSGGHDKPLGFDD